MARFAIPKGFLLGTFKFPILQIRPLTDGELAMNPWTIYFQTARSGDYEAFFVQAPFRKI